jgi:L-iditol 2-dehydrogenase
MKAAVYYANDDVRIEEIPVPEIGDDELLVQVVASGICGSDVMEWYRIKKAPRVLGHEIAGDVVKVGKKITSFREGDRVFATHHVPCGTCPFCEAGKHTLCETLRSTNFYPGGFAEYLRIPAINVEKGTFKLPDELSYEDATFIEPLACVVRGLRRAGFAEGQRVLVVGSGISGLLHVKLVRAWGAATVMATDVNEYRLRMARKFGADAVALASEDVAARVRELNGGDGADLVVTCTGAPAAVAQAVASVGRGGIILFFAPTEPGITIPFPLFDLWNNGITMVSTYAGAPNDIEEAIDLLKTGTVRVADMITHKLPLSRAQEGFQLVAEAHESVKVLLMPHRT